MMNNNNDYYVAIIGGDETTLDEFVALLKKYNMVWYIRKFLVVNGIIKDWPIELQEFYKAAIKKDKLDVICENQPKNKIKQILKKKFNYFGD